MDVLLWPIYQVTDSFVQSLWQEKFHQQVQASVKAALPFEPYDPEDLMILELSVKDRNALWSLRKASKEYDERKSL